jgi:peptidyl-tRNA hydrolase
LCRVFSFSQGLLQLREKDVVVVCRKEDIAMVREVLPAAIADARRRANDNTLNAELTDKFNLAPARTSAKQTDAW